MANKQMMALGNTRSAIRDLFEFGKQLALERGAENVFDFSLGNPNIPAPDCVFESIARHSQNPNTHGYTSAQGDISVRKKIAEYNNQMWGVGLSADDIYITMGAAPALILCFRSLNEDNNEFITIAPFFPEYRVFVENSGAKLVVCQSKEDFSLDIQAIENAINKNTKGIIINSPNNPAGNIYSEQEIKALSEMLERKQTELNTNIYLISDEPYREITYGKEVVNPMLYYNNTIICYSFSKTLSLAGERIGYVAISPKATDNRDIYAAICGSGRAIGYVCAPSLFQQVIGDCLGKTSDISAYKKNRDLIYGIMTKLNFECVKPEGAFYLFVKCPIDPQEFFEVCKGEGVLVVPSESFGVKGYFRISYCVATDTITRSAPRFEAIAKKCGLI